jgi:import inner membrane translocase subunit TIM44
MDQVKKEAEANERLRKDLEQVQGTAERLHQKSARQEERFNRLSDHLKDFSADTSERFSAWRTRAGAASDSMNRYSEEVEVLKRMRKVAQKGFESGAMGSRAARNAFAGVMDTTQKAFSYFGDEDNKAEKLKRWKAERDLAEAAAKAAGEDAEAANHNATAADVEGAEETKAAEGKTAEASGALVVSEARSSSWDRLGASLSDMPFLSSVFENPLFERLFGESEIAASLREMKENEYGFALEDFTEDMEYVIAPHIIRSFLEGNAESLEKHCGDAAFAAVNASIKTRKQEKLSLDTAILAGPEELELKGAQRMENGPPAFIWMFHMQQINCLRDGTGEIVEGAVDDIRTVHYAMAVKRHPDPQAPGLEYPWEVTELAILGNAPSW